MFGFRGGESAETVARKKVYMQDAQQRWGCLTTFDLSTIKNGVQLGPIARDRYSLSDAEAKDNVAEWVRGKEFSLIRPRVLMRLRTPLNGGSK